MSNMSKVWAIVKMEHGIDGRASPPQCIIKRIFDMEIEAKDAVFHPYQVKEVEIDFEKEMAAVERKLTPSQRYALSTYNEIGIKEHLKL